MDRLLTKTPFRKGPCPEKSDPERRSYLPKIQDFEFSGKVIFQKYQKPKFLNSEIQIYQLKRKNFS